jgi:hypothetical protein
VLIQRTFPSRSQGQSRRGRGIGETFLPSTSDGIFQGQQTSQGSFLQVLVISAKSSTEQVASKTWISLLQRKVTPLHTLYELHPLSRNLGEGFDTLQG